MADPFSFYDLLGVAPSASTDEIKRAYRLRIAKYHPDVNASGDAQALVAMLNEAWAVLRDAERRRDYDAAISPGAKIPLQASPGSAHRTAGEIVRYLWQRADLVASQDTQTKHRWGRRQIVGLSAVAVAIMVVVALGFVHASSVDEAALEVASPEAAEPVGSPAATEPVAGVVSPCRWAVISNVSENGARVVTGDGGSYAVAATALGRVVASSWSTGDRVVVCGSGSFASIDNPSRYERVAATVEGSRSASSVRCFNRAIANVADGGAKISTSGGALYAVAPQADARLQAASWNTGDRVVVCTSGSSASIENLTHDAKVQTTIQGIAAAPPIRCGNRTIAGVGADGAWVSTSGGGTYQIVAQGRGQVKASSWSTGDRIVVCTSGSSASIENSALDQKVQTIRSS